MAKAHTIDDVVQSIIDNYQTLLQDAVVHVAEQAQKDIYDKAVNVLYEYYYGGYEPKSYDRIYALQHSIVPFSRISTAGQKIQCVVGVEYSPDALEEYLGTLSGSPYKASKKYGTANTEWVVENFWEGKHPYTNGSSEPGAEIKYYKSYVTQDEGMRKNDEITGPGLLYYAHTIFPRAVMNHMIVSGSKLF
jgi:hypothetical protein